MKKIICILLCGFSVAGFAGERAAPSKSIRQDQSLAFQKTHPIVAQNFIAGTTVKSAVRAASAQRATVIARAATTRMA